MAPPRALLAAALLVLGGFLLLADFAPVIAAPRGGGPASPAAAATAAIARFALAPTCHQRSERSLLVASVRLAACARCTGLYAGGVLAGILILAGVRFRAGRGHVLVLGSLAAMALEVAAGMAWPTWDHPMLRFTTGILVVASVGVAAAGLLMLSPPPESNPSVILAGAPR